MLAQTLKLGPYVVWYFLASEAMSRRWIISFADQSVDFCFLNVAWMAERGGRKQYRLGQA